MTALLIVIDVYFLNGYLKIIIPITPEKTFWYVILFGLPHIVASEVTFIRREYLQHYKNFIIVMLLIALGSSIVLNLFIDEQIAYAIVAIWTMIHVIGQQVGLSKVNLSTVDWSFNCWKWSLITSACFMMLGLGNPQAMAFAPLYLKYTALTIFAMSNLFFYLVVSKSSNRIGYWYCISTHMMVVVSVISFAIGYSFFAILIPRVIHDVTAFIFYIVHDYNYSQENSKGFLKASNNLLLQIFTVPFIAIFLAFVFNQYFSSVFILTLILLHYLLETRIWKHNSFHRKHINFT